MVFQLIEKEKERQAKNIELIASENFVSDNVLRALGSCLTNKYSEGYPAQREDNGRKGRYYGGCEYVDQIEEYCCHKWREVFSTDYHVNVQPHSGSQANMAAYLSVIKPGDTILAMNLNNGGHLTHGSSVNFSGRLFKTAFYDVDENGFLNYDDIAEKIRSCRPALVLAGASAYSRIIDFDRIYKIICDTAEEVRRKQGYDGWEIGRPYFMVDMAHIAGLIAVGAHPTPFGLADIITTTTHKTLRGPRGGMIFCTQELAKQVDGSVFPGMQGGALQHVVAAKAIAAEEACTEEYRKYIFDVVKNCKAMCDEFVRLGYDVVTGGTDNHLFLLDLSRTHPELTGKAVQDELDRHGITLNKNCVPNEKRSPVQTSGVRIGTAAETTKGKTAEDFVEIAREIDRIISAM
ncbi:MAG: serine hydroxymethyltransferase [Oscillospiraceae bacterium]